MDRAEYRVLLSFIAAMLLFTGARAGEGTDGIVKSSSLSRDSILIGDQTVWSLELEVDRNDSLVILPYELALKGDTTGAKVEPLTRFELDTAAFEGGRVKINAKILLTSFDSGLYSLPAPLFIVVGAEGADTLRIESPLLAVDDMDIDTTGYVMKDIKGNVRYPLTFKEIAIYVLILLAAVAIICIIVRYIRYRRQNRDFFGRPIVQDPPHIVALRKLEKLRGEKLWQCGREKQYYTGITDALREYIENRYNIGAREMTSAEILDNLKDKQIEARVFSELDDLLKTADLVKFAKFSPDNDSNEEAVPKAVRFVNSTFMQEMEQEKEKEKEAE